ncbi:MAG: formate dehydrogenase accessory sulfurtransferase FdhD [Candidatus Bathyarchaeota archaeon]|jgi:FdhD protein
MSLTISAERIEIATGVRRAVKEPVAMEASVDIYVNDKHLITLLSTPRLHRELALGWLFDEGVLQFWTEIDQVNIVENKVMVRTKKPLQKEKLSVVGATRALTTTRGLSIDKFLKIISQNGSKTIKSDYKIRANQIIRMVNQLDDQAKLFKLTGGTHASALYEEGELVAFAEDISRHNAIDKVIGIAVQSGVDFSRCVLASSGRQPADMVFKAVRMNIPIIASRASPIHSGIVLAKKVGVTLICFVRKQRMNIYTYPSRILF